MRPIDPRRLKGILGCCLAAALATGCQSLPTDIPTLDEARQDHAAAEHEPAVLLFASEEMELAEQAMLEADRSWARNEGEVETEHLAYIAKQRVVIARMSAELACRR